MDPSDSNKRKEEATLEETPVKKTKLSRGARKRRNKKLKWELERREASETDVLPGINSSTNNIVFDPLRHRTQFATRGLCTEDKVYYIENEWRSVSLCVSDRISSKEIKTIQDVSARDLLIATLIREARPTTNPLEMLEIPPDFLTLVDDEIITPQNDPRSKDATTSDDETNELPSIDTKKRLWIAFGRWLGLDKNGPIKRRQVRRYLKSRWANLQHGLELQNNKDSQGIFDIAIVRNTQKRKTRLSMTARDNFQSLDRLVGFRHVVKPECITDMDGRTLIHLEQLDDQIAVTRAVDAVNGYYFHTLNNPSHRSNGFWENFIEHFGAYTLYNILPYTSSHTASSHNIDHLECVNNLLCELGPLSDSINRFIESYYKSLYEKLSKLKWGAFIPRPFGIFPMIAINFNTMSDFHWDEHDDPNSLCCLIALGDFEGGELCFPQLQIVIPLRPGQIVAFSSRLLLHGNLPITRGIRHSIVYFVHSMFFHHLRDFSSIYDDLRDGIERDARGAIVPMIPQQDLNDARDLNKRIRLDKPKPSQIRVPPSSSDCRRGRIDLRRARHGLKAEDPLPE